MSYSVKEIYATVQGEGFHTGRPAVFLRFAGCNLWSGFERDRVGAVCQFCDTDFVGMDGPGGGRFADAPELALAVDTAWQRNIGTANRFAVLTGGEPLLQLDGDLLEALHARGFEVAIETNGTLPAPPGIDWICVSPKSGAELVQRSGNELKLVYPQIGIDPGDFEHLRFDHFFLQPMDGSDFERNTDLTIGFCRCSPRWKVSIQTHKYLGIP